jgi:hypothetical protein
MDRKKLLCPASPKRHQIEADQAYERAIGLERDDLHHHVTTWLVKRTPGSASRADAPPPTLMAIAFVEADLIWIIKGLP